MIVVSILPHVEFGPNDHREDAPHFTMLSVNFIIKLQVQNLMSRRVKTLTIRDTHATSFENPLEFMPF